MIKQSAILLIAFCVIGVANAGFIACPSNMKSPVYDGKTYGKWNVSIADKKGFTVKTSTPGLVKVKNSSAPGLACYADNTANFPRPEEYKKPLYNVVLYYSGTCVNPKIDKAKNGFWCR